MICEWVRKSEGSDRLILIFGGWGTDAALYRDVEVPGWDVLVCHDFDETPFDNDLIRRYTTIYLYAWSLGVSAAAHMPDRQKITAAFAINGTEWPCDDLRGIPVKIFTGTADTLTLDNLMRFRRRMFRTSSEYKCVAPSLPAAPDIDSLKRQLYIVRDRKDYNPAENFWTRVYISANDRIFPAENQRRAWQNRGIDICERVDGHYINLAEVVGNTIPNPEIVGKKFSASLPTYDQHASAQRQIAGRLVEALAAHRPAVGMKVLEIGQGSGLSTRLFGNLLNPAEMDCVDLYTTPQMTAAPVMRYHEADAEKWIAASPSASWNCIVSSSAIQWFSDIRAFIRHAARCLTSDGILACATFGPGNLGELDALRPSPMLYRTPAQLRTWLEQHFNLVEVETDEIRLTFNSAREALVHLQRTGVGGSARHGLTVNQLLEAIPRDSDRRAYLTYRPVYIIASNPR